MLSSLLFYRLKELVADALHSFYGRVAVLLFDVIELYELDAAVLADLAEGLVHLFLKFGVENGVNGSLGVFSLKSVEQAGECRPEILAVVGRPVGVFVFSYRGVCQASLVPPKTKMMSGLPSMSMRERNEDLDVSHPP